MAKIRAQVALVLDVEQIAIDAGADHGVAEGDTVSLLREVVIPNPSQPGASLGTAFVKKGSMVIESVDAKFSLARVRQVNRGASLFNVTYERDFSIVDSQAKEGDRRVFVKQSDPVDVHIPDEDLL